MQSTGSLYLVVSILATLIPGLLIGARAEAPRNPPPPPPLNGNSGNDYNEHLKKLLNEPESEGDFGIANLMTEHAPEQPPHSAGDPGTGHPKDPLEPQHATEHDDYGIAAMMDENLAQKTDRGDAKHAPSLASPDETVNDDGSGAHGAEEAKAAPHKSQKKKKKKKHNGAPVHGAHKVHYHSGNVDETTVLDEREGQTVVRHEEGTEHHGEVAEQHVQGQVADQQTPAAESETETGNFGSRLANWWKYNVNKSLADESASESVSSKFVIQNNVDTPTVEENQPGNENKIKKTVVPFKLIHENVDNEDENAITARVHCTFGGNVTKMYKKVKKYFEGDLCHAIVFGTPAIIHENSISMPLQEIDQLKQLKYIKKHIMSIVVMKHVSYEQWSEALSEKRLMREVKMIMRFVKKYSIDGIQFANLQPTAEDQLDTEMLCKIIGLFKEINQRNNKLQLGLTISSYKQSIRSSFASFQALNKIVNWYSINTISMVKCSSAYLTGTSPLSGSISLENTILEFMKTEIDSRKIIVNIQLYANKIGDLKPYTYGEMCKDEDENKNKWCAAPTEEYRLKGRFLRDCTIWGVNLYYMDADDIKNDCECERFPCVRALLRGLAKCEEQEDCENIGNTQNEDHQCQFFKVQVHE